MDTVSDPDISFDENGICNYYYQYQKANDPLPKTEEDGKARLAALAEKIRMEGSGKPYDCILGLSGGVDSGYIAWLVMQRGLRPLAVHFDNGWNSGVAERNIQNILRHTGFEYRVIQMDSAEYRDIQLAYLRASVVDIEAPTDHAIFTTLFKLAAKHGIKYALKGTNHQTECTMPRTWNFSKMDHVNIKSIHKRFGRLPLKTFPLMDAKMKRMDMRIKGLQGVPLLHCVPYSQQRAKEIIRQEFEWEDYGGKHYESIWTRFYQGYILPVKFGIDKRKAHLSDLIFGGEITKEEALRQIAKPSYDAGQLEADKELVLSRLGLSENEFETIMQAPVRSHHDFDYEMPIDKRYPILKPLKKIYRAFRS